MAAEGRQVLQPSLVLQHEHAPQTDWQRRQLSLGELISSLRMLQGPPQPFFRLIWNYCLL
jgi:hypothetical protein